MSLSRTFRKIAGVGAIALGAFITIISGGVGAPLGFKVALVGAAMLSSLKKPKLPVTTGFGTELQLSGDPSEVRKIIYGEAWTGGALRFRQSTGTDNRDLYLVIVLAGHECDSVTAVEADREELTLDSSGNVTAPSKWVGLMNVRSVLGTDSQAVDSTLDSTFTEWTSNHRLRGCTYAIVKLTFDETNLASPPQFRFKVKGRKVYDPRLDSTNGGSGTHRLATPSTWAWSENVVLCANDFLRGISINSIYIAGLGLASARFVWSNVAAEADVCDQSVALISGTQKRYTANGVIDPRQPPGEILRHFEMAFAGDIIPSDGFWRFFAGAYRTPTLLLEPKHFIGPLRHVVHKGEMDRYDTANGQYASQAESGTAIDYAPISTSSVTVGSERVLPLSFQLVNDVTDTPGTYDGGARAQRIAKLLLEKEAAGKTITCTTSLYGLRAMPGETIQITHAAFGLTTQDMRVLDVTLRMVQDGDKAGLVVDLTLEAGPSSLYTWSADETVIGAAPTLTQAQVPFRPPARGWASDSQGKPSGIRLVECDSGSAVRTQVSFGSGSSLKISSSPLAKVGYGVPAIPINELKTYPITVRYSANLITNGGGEFGMVGTLADGWTHSAGNNLEPATDEFQYGARSLKIDNTVANDSYSYQDVTLIGGVTYLVSAWIKTSAMPTADAGTGAFINVEIVSGITSYTIVSKTTVGSDPSAATPDCGIAADNAAHDWTNVRCQFTPLANGVIRVYAQLGYGGNQSGIAWFDEISVMPQAGFYLRVNEKASALVAGKTHVGIQTGGSGGTAEAVVDDRDSFVDLVSNGPMPGGTPVEQTYLYTPTAGTVMASLSFYNWGVAPIDLEVEWAGLTEFGKSIDLLPGVQPPSDKFDLNPGSVNINSLATESVAGASETTRRMRAESAFTPDVDCEVQVIGVMDQESSFDGDSGTFVFVAILPTANITTGLGFDQLPALLTGVQFGAGGRIQAGTRTSMVSQGIFAVTAGVPYTACIANIHGVGTVKFWDLQLTVQQVQR